MARWEFALPNERSPLMSDATNVLGAHPCPALVKRGNVLKMIQAREGQGQEVGEKAGGGELELEEYVPSAPAIKVALGLVGIRFPFFLLLFRSSGGNAL